MTLTSEYHQSSKRLTLTFSELNEKNIEIAKSVIKSTHPLEILQLDFAYQPVKTPIPTEKILELCAVLIEKSELYEIETIGWQKQEGMEGKLDFLKFLTPSISKNQYEDFTERLKERYKKNKIAKIKNLKSVYLNQLTITDENLYEILSMINKDSIEELDLSDNLISDRGFKALFNLTMPNLKSLNIRNNIASEDFVNILVGKLSQHFKSLTTLELGEIILPIVKNTDKFKAFSNEISNSTLENMDNTHQKIREILNYNKIKNRYPFKSDEISTSVQLLEKLDNETSKKEILMHMRDTVNKLLHALSVDNHSLHRLVFLNNYHDYIHALCKNVSALTAYINFLELKSTFKKLDLPIYRVCLLLGKALLFHTGNPYEKEECLLTGLTLLTIVINGIKQHGFIYEDDISLIALYYANLYKVMEGGKITESKELTFEAIAAHPKFTGLIETLREKKALIEDESFPSKIKEYPKNERDFWNVMSNKTQEPLSVKQKRKVVFYSGKSRKHPVFSGPKDTPTYREKSQKADLKIFEITAKK